MNVLTPPQVAERWKCKPETVRRLLETGALPGFTLSPPGTRRPRWRVTIDAVLAHESGEAAKPSSKKTRSRRRQAVAPTGPF